MQEARQPAVDQAYRRSAAAPPSGGDEVLMTTNPISRPSQGSQGSRGSQANEGVADPREPGPHQV
jgi:hypothetical protein